METLLARVEKKAVITQLLNMQQ